MMVINLVKLQLVKLQLMLLN